MKGNIFNIKKYAVHDGPGIRTTVFFKGCPLKCAWCHNPESIQLEAELTMNKDKCINCQHCEDFTDAEACPTLALEKVGKDMTVDELLVEILKDVVFYDESQGGVTFSGGEPLLQHSFLLEILKTCKTHNLHTTLDTTGYSKWENIEKLLPYVDLMLYDLKHMEDVKHQSLTGVSNVLIVENFKKIIKTNKVYVRVPLIKGYNDSFENINALCDLIKHKNVLQLNLLLYHNYAENKYENLMNLKSFEVFEAPKEEHVEKIAAMCREKGIKTYIGG